MCTPSPPLGGPSSGQGKRQPSWGQPGHRLATTQPLAAALPPAPGPRFSVSPQVPSAHRRQKRSWRWEGALPLRPLRLQCQRRGAFKGISGSADPPVPKSRIKIEAGAPDGLAAQLPRAASLSPMGRSRAHQARHPSCKDSEAQGWSLLGWDSKRRPAKWG